MYALKRRRQTVGAVYLLCGDPLFLNMGASGGSGAPAFYGRSGSYGIYLFSTGCGSSRAH